MPLAYLVLSPGSPQERAFPVDDRIFVGRECAGIDDAHRVLLADPVLSRTHFEIRLDERLREAYLVDTSTNGTRINGSRVSRAMPHPLKAGDWVTAGTSEFAFQSGVFTGESIAGSGRETIASINLTSMVMVVGDLTSYSTISQVTEHTLVAETLQTLYEELTALLAAHRGTLNHYAGDAIFAVWELDQIPDANDLAVRFALAASQRVDEMAPTLRLRGPDGAVVRMGWAVVCGPAAVTTLTHSAISVVGDTTNLAFRLSGLAGRAGRASILVSSSVHEQVRDRFRWAAPEYLDTKGRSGQETVYPVVSRL